MELPKRKPNRLCEYDYNQNGAYFVTICTQDRKQILSKIYVGTGVLCKDHIVYKMFGDIVYTLHKKLTPVYPLGYDELFVYIYFGNSKVPITNRNGLFVQI